MINHLNPVTPLNPPVPAIPAPDWPYGFTIDGEDLVVNDIVITCFGGNGDGTNSDPQDNGITASGLNTNSTPVDAVSIAMDSRQFPGMQKRDQAGYAALLGAPFPRIPWGTPVEVTIGGFTYTPARGIQELGPGLHASKPGEPHGLDLSTIAARHFRPFATLNYLSRYFEERGSFRVIGGAKWIS